jgi:uncharacterized membrane protein
MIDKLKGAWRSWTIHFNLYMAALLEGLPLLKDSFTELQPYIPANLFQIGMTVLIIGNVALRFKTTTCLSAK